jgi:hypothetical protein
MTKEQDSGVVSLDAKALDAAIKAWATATEAPMSAAITAYLSAIVPPPDVAWRCFHCDEVFTGVDAARAHFGVDSDWEPGCMLKLTEEEKDLLAVITRLQNELSRYHEEDSDKDREIVALSAKHQSALRDAEQTGYDRGLADAKAYPETLGLIALTGKYGEVLHPFISMMERELHANSGKGDRPGWMAMSRQDLLLEIYHHLAKLQKATLNNDTAGIGEFSADVANMSMMLADLCGTLSSVGATPPVTSDRASTQTDVSPTAAVPSHAGATPSALDLSASPSLVGEAVAWLGAEVLAVAQHEKPLPMGRDHLGREVRTAWVRWAELQPNPKPSWLVPYDELSEPDKEADRLIGEYIALGVLGWFVANDPTVDHRTRLAPSPSTAVVSEPVREAIAAAAYAEIMRSAHILRADELAYAVGQLIVNYQRPPSGTEL